MKFNLLLLLIPFWCFAQEEETSNDNLYLQFEVAFPLIGNPDRYNEITGDYDKPRLKIDGIGSKFGVGLHHNKWLGVSVHSGIDWKVSSKLVTVPIYGNLRIAPNFGDDMRLILQVGYGFGTAIGRGNLSGDYKKLSLGIGDSDLLLYGEFASYGFALDSPHDIYSVSVGIAITTF